MNVGIGIPSTIPWTNSELILTWMERADESPFSSLAVLDRLVYPNYESMITLAAAAARTRRVRLITTVLLAPIRNTAFLAKQAASIDALSGGRLTLGLGIGGLTEIGREAIMGGEGDVLRVGHHQVGHHPCFEAAHAVGQHVRRHAA